MLISSHAMYGSVVFGTDVVAGTIRDFLFDDQSWKSSTSWSILDVG